MVDEGTTWRSLPTDAFVEILLLVSFILFLRFPSISGLRPHLRRRAPVSRIRHLLRLPPSTRRWVRLVCRHWRAVIDERTPPPSKPAVLACFTSTTSASAYVIDDLATGACRQVWEVSADDPAYAVTRDWRQRVDVTMVGTCNGLLCLCDNNRPGGGISLLNPATRETLRLPPLPVSGHQGGRYSDYGSGETYGFGFHPMTGRYTVLHLPCRADVTGGFTSLQVFTLGHLSRAWAWRDVPVSFPGGATATCSADAGLVTVDGATYWVTKDAGGRVASFDHEDERVTLAPPLPVVGGRGSGYVLRLAEVRGRLGLAVRADRDGPAKTEVWVLLGRRQGWSRQYNVQVQAEEVWQRLAGPHFAHGGYVLTVSANEYRRKHLYAHRMRDSGEVRSLRIREQGTVVAYCNHGYYLRTFSYVETTEPLLSLFKSRQQAVHTKLSAS